MDPLDDDDATGDLDNDGASNRGEYVRGYDPNDDSSVPPIIVVYVDDDAAGDPAPGDGSVSDPAEDGSSSHPFDTIQEAIDVVVDKDAVIDFRLRRRLGSAVSLLTFSVLFLP